MNSPHVDVRSSETMLSLEIGDAAPISAPRAPEAGDGPGPGVGAKPGAGAKPGVGRKFGALQVLRLAGAVTLLTATGSFLFRDWEMLHSVPVYVQLLVTTVLLSVAGLACGAFLREAKGARTFLSIALYAVPLNFAALGGLVFASGASVTDAPLLAGSTLLTTSISSVVLAGVAWVGFRALARPHARSLWLALLAGSALLLIPLRELWFVTPLLGVGLVATALYQRFSLPSSAALNTFEGWVARAAVMVPAVLLLARTMVYYDADPAFYVVAFGGMSAFAWVTSGRVESRGFRVALEMASVALAAVACCSLPFAAEPFVGDPEAEGWDILQYGWAFVSVSFGAVLALMGATAATGKRFYNGAAGVVAVVGMGITLLSYDAAVPAALASILVAASAVAFGYGTRSAVACGAGLLLTVAGVVGLFVGITELETLRSWPTFAVLGALAIVTASLIERKGAAMKRQVTRLRTRFN